MKELTEAYHQAVEAFVTGKTACTVLLGNKMHVIHLGNKIDFQKEFDLSAPVDCACQVCDNKCNERV